MPDPGDRVGLPFRILSVMAERALFAQGLAVRHKHSVRHQPCAVSRRNAGQGSVWPFTLQAVQTDRITGVNRTQMCGLQVQRITPVLALAVMSVRTTITRADTARLSSGERLHCMSTLTAIRMKGHNHA